MYILFSANRYDNLNRSTTLTFTSAWCGLFPLRHILQHVKLQHTNCSLFLAQYYYLSRQLIVTGKFLYGWLLLTLCVNNVLLDNKGIHCNEVQTFNYRYKV